MWGIFHYLSLRELGAGEVLELFSRHRTKTAKKFDKKINLLISSS
jgi:hypothetical protein